MYYKIMNTARCMNVLRFMLVEKRSAELHIASPLLPIELFALSGSLFLVIFSQD